MRGVTPVAAFWAVSVIAVSSGHAGLTAHEAFNYTPAASLGGQAGGFGFSGAWAASTPTIASGNLSFGSLPTSGNSVSAPAPNESENRALASPLGAAGTTAYISFLIQSPGPLDDTKAMGLGLLGSGGNLFIGQPSAGPATIQWVLENFSGGGQASTGIDALQGVTAFLVVRADFTSGNDTFRLYVNPSLESEPGIANAIKSDFDFGTIGSVQINGSHTFLFDELRIGTTYADVVPEPGMTAGLVGLALCWTRRRR